ncbi:MAG: amidohydrolase [Clostridia bacterium]|nr:amidohydrolase [Clostridia bacterium]MBN2882041.1 amidohydrolase [Clostridia bacterium]
MLLVKNGKVYTMKDQNGFMGYVLVEDDKIKKVGKMDELPAGIEEKCDRVIDAAGGFIMPGFIDPHCHVGMWENGIGFEGADGNEMTDPVTPHMRAIDGIYYKDRSFGDAMKAGITTVVTGPGSANVIGGQFAALKTYGNSIEEMLLKEPVAMKMAFGENPKRVYSGQKKSPSTRMATAAILREALMEAKAYRERPDADKEKVDFKKEALAQVFDGLLVKIHAHREDDILTAIRIGREFGLNFTIEHCTEGYLIKDILKKENIPVIVGPLLSFRSKFELTNSTIKNPGLLQKHGVKTAIMTDHHVIPIQYLPLCAGVAVKEGMDELEALRAISLYAAEVTGIEDRVGSLETGKDADIAVFDGNPLEIRTGVIATVINGVVVYEG